MKIKKIHSGWKIFFWFTIAYLILTVSTLVTAFTTFDQHSTVDWIEYLLLLSMASLSCIACYGYIKRKRFFHKWLWYCLLLALIPWFASSFYTTIQEATEPLFVTLATLSIGTLYFSAQLLLLWKYSRTWQNNEPN